MTLEMPKNEPQLISRIQPQYITAVYALVSIILCFLHNTFEEWDGVMQLLAGKEIFSGSGYRGWASHFWPPLYSVLAGLGSLVMPGFVAAKLVSLISGIILFHISFYFALEITKGKTIAVLTQVFLMINPTFLISTIQAENHMLDSLFFVSAIWFLLRSIKTPNPGLLFATGLLCGLAGLTRYTSYVLVPASIIALIALFSFKNGLRYCLYLLAGFIVASSPWWIYNSIVHGSALHTWQYMNIGFAVVPDADQDKWWWQTQGSYSSISDIMKRMPAAYIRNFAANVLLSVHFIGVATGVLIAFVWPSVFVSFLKLRPAYLLSILLSAGFFIALAGQAFVFDQVFLSWGVVFTILSLWFILDWAGSLSARFALLSKYNFRRIFLVVLVIGGLVLTTVETTKYLNNTTDGGQLSDHRFLTEALQRHDSNIHNKTIMALHPARAYAAGSKFMMIPRYFEGSLAELVTYGTLNERVLEYAPKFPTPRNNSSIRADYLVFDRHIERRLPQFSFIFDPSSKNIPPNFQVVYRSQDVVAFEIKY
jgi:hypothetical protein